MTHRPLKIGAFGTGNLGDDLMLQAILAAEPEAHVVAYGKPLLPHDVPYILHHDFMRCPEAYLEKCSSLDFGGGNLFWSEANLVEMLVLSQQARLLGLPVTLNRVGLHGFELNKDYARLLLKLVDRVTVRDSQSLDIAMHLGRSDCELRRDYVFDLFDDYSSSSLSGPPFRVGINFSDIRMTSADEEFIKYITGIFADLAGRFTNTLQFNYIPFCIHRTYAPENDAIVACRFWEQSGGLIQYVDDISTTECLIKKVDEMDILIGLRFHMQVLGYALKKHVIPLTKTSAEPSKYSAIAHDNGANPIAFEGVTQDFVLQQIDRRLRLFIDKSATNLGEHDN